MLSGLRVSLRERWDLFFAHKAVSPGNNLSIQDYYGAYGHFSFLSPFAGFFKRFKHKQVACHLPAVQTR